MRIALLITGWFIFVAGSLFAQNSTYKGYNPNNTAFGYQAHYFTQQQHRVYSAIELRTQSGLSATNKPIGNLPFHMVGFKIGYEHLFGTYWSGGANWQYEGIYADRMRTLQAYLQHNGSIGRVYFIKRLVAEDLRHRDRSFQDRGRIGLGIDLIYPFSVKNMRFMAKASYTALQDQNWYNKLLPSENRFVDFTLAELSLAVLIKKGWVLSFFGQRETFYYLGQASFDGNGNIVNPERKVNIITPVWGIRLQSFFNTEKALPWLYRFTGNKEIPEN